MLSAAVKLFKGQMCCSCEMFLVFVILCERSWW